MSKDKDQIELRHQCEIRFYWNGEHSCSFAKFSDKKLDQLDIILFVNETLEKHQKFKDYKFRIYQQEFYTTDSWDIINA